MILIINIIAVFFLERFLTSNTEANGAKLFQLLDYSASCALKVICSPQWSSDAIANWVKNTLSQKQDKKH